jgi:hypothetical protein
MDKERLWVKLKSPAVWTNTATSVQSTSVGCSGGEDFLIATKVGDPNWKNIAAVAMFAYTNNAPVDIMIGTGSELCYTNRSIIFNMKVSAGDLTGTPTR